MEDITKYNDNIFENIRKFDENGNEYWEARQLQKTLEYKEWRNFKKILDKAISACNLSGNKVFDHFVEFNKMVEAGVSLKKIEDYKLSRYACYLIVQNGDSRKKVIALGQTYFAVQTRRMELCEENYSRLSEDEKRLIRRKQTKDGNKLLYKVASEKGVKNFDKFTNAGYKGLYNGESADDIARRKNLRYREDILDNMSSVELGANIFRITQTESLLEKQNEKNEQLAIGTHFKVGRAVRETIKSLGGTMPEDLPTPNKSIKEIQNEMDKKLERLT